MTVDCRAPETGFLSPYGMEPWEIMSSTAEAVGLPKGKSIKQIEILVVQSNPADTFLTIEALKAAGLRNGPRCVSEGEDALMYLLRRGPHANAPIPDLIFLDLSQPTVAALEVLKAIKSTPALTHIPIVVAAGSDDPQFVKAVYALNGNCFIRKPNELATFVLFIDRCYQFWCGIVTLASSRPNIAQGTALGGQSNDGEREEFSRTLVAPPDTRGLR
jgi:CheY-like chemotaxis protein